STICGMLYGLPTGSQIRGEAHTISRRGAGHVWRVCRRSLTARHREPARAEGRREMSLPQLASVCLIGLVLISCAKTMSYEEKANAARVRITNNPEFTRGCAFV